MTFIPKRSGEPRPGGNPVDGGAGDGDDLAASTPVEVEADALLARVRTCVADALARTAHRRNDEAVHAARQALKRGRAALRLFEDGGVKAARPLRRELTEAARRLSPLRDAAVAAQLAARLMSGQDGFSRKVARVMAGARPRRPSVLRWRKWRADLEATLARLNDLPTGEWEPGSLAAALERSVKKARRTAKRFGGGRDLDQAHEWRKALVTLREQALYVFPAANPEIHHHLHRVTHRLGRALDCRVLRRLMKKRRWSASLGRGPHKFATQVARKQRHWLERAWHSWRKLKPLLRDLPIAEVVCL